MNVKKIVVDELPNMCIDCKLSFYSRDNEVYICFATKNRIANSQVIPDWCPLEVEEVCEWNGEYGGYDEHGDMIFFSKKTGCSDVHIQKVSVPNNNFCSNCGKRIKYVESEE